MQIWFKNIYCPNTMISKLIWVLFWLKPCLCISVLIDLKTDLAVNQTQRCFVCCTVNAVGCHVGLTSGGNLPDIQRRNCDWESSLIVFSWLDITQKHTDRGARAEADLSLYGVVACHWTTGFQTDQSEMHQVWPGVWNYLTATVEELYW